MSENVVTRDKNKKAEPEKVLFGDCDTLSEIAAKLISKHHTHLATAEIRYTCRSKAAKRAGEPLAGNVYKMSGKFRHLTDVDFVVEVALDVWNNLDPAKRYALTDHLLSRLVGTEDEETGDMKWGVRPPPVQEFPEVADRHGTWNEGLVEIKRCLKDN